MKITCFALLVVGIVLANERSAQAADLYPAVRSATPTVVLGSRLSRRVLVRRAYGARRVFVRRAIGMPCVLPPHVIVQKNWNGPQCRWVDNVIPGDLRVHYHVAARR